MVRRPPSPNPKLRLQFCGNFFSNSKKIFIAPRLGLEVLFCKHIFIKFWALGFRLCDIIFQLSYYYNASRGDNSTEYILLAKTLQTVRLRPSNIVVQVFAFWKLAPFTYFTQAGSRKLAKLLYRTAQLKKYNFHSILFKRLTCRVLKDVTTRL